MTSREPKPSDEPQRQQPEATKSGTRMGFFAVPVELVGAVLLIGMGVRFITISNQPDVVGYVLFVVAAVLVIDAIRRLRRITTGKEKY
ncbi:MAG TPA: hypothetical protein VIG67_09590 [Yaniella sp.]